ncbi:MAG: RDD family protein [Lysobacteraceae bacterium]
MEKSNQMQVGKSLTKSNMRLASRGLRLGGSLLDTFIMSVILLPLIYFTGAWQIAYDAAKQHETPSLSFSLMWSAIGLAIFVVVFGYPLVKDGQTWGKKLVRTKIVDMDGNLPSLKQLCVRYAIANCVGAIPFVGRIGSLVDICLIFREDKRCGHDLAAGTQVVDVFQEPGE